MQGGSAPNAKVLNVNHSETEKQQKNPKITIRKPKPTIRKLILAYMLHLAVPLRPHRYIIRLLPFKK
jgi:hypothetical protein